MPKKIKNIFLQNLTFEKLMQAHYRAKKHKTYKNEVIKFEFNLENNIINLMNNLRNKTYRLGKYYTFKVYEPKERYIQALPYKDRIVHQWYVEEFIKPYILPKFIRSTYACLPDKGTHRAVADVQHQMQVCKRNNKNFWILKCDVKKFFYSINPYILFNIIKRFFADPYFLHLTQVLIFNGPIDKSAVGIPIGNYTSQFFANIYLNELDQFVKRDLKIKYYTRYMDDFILILKNKQECIYIKNEIETFLKSNLKLELNDKSRYYPSKMGVNFCGYRIFPTHRLLRTSSKKKINKNIKKWNYQYKNKKLDINYANQSLNSWIAHASHSNSFLLTQKIINKCNFIYTNSTDLKIEKNLIFDIENYNKHIQDT